MISFIIQLVALGLVTAVAGWELGFEGTTVAAITFAAQLVWIGRKIVWYVRMLVIHCRD